ncbi:MAG: hypothetical protein IJZ46_00455 [Bacilli bacterium]|nr:hypothetical protein [Bacilli bacterium]
MKKIEEGLYIHKGHKVYKEGDWYYMYLSIGGHITPMKLTSDTQKGLIAVYNRVIEKYKDYQY